MTACETFVGLDGMASGLYNGPDRETIKMAIQIAILGLERVSPAEHFQPAMDIQRLLLFERMGGQELIGNDQPYSCKEYKKRQFYIGSLFCFMRVRRL